MQKIFIILMGLLFLNTAHAQKYCKASGYAFSILIQPGTIPVDENGVPIKRRINKERFIYIITMGKLKPTISSVMYGKTPVKWDLPNSAEKEFSAVTETTQKTMNIKPSKGCSMWRLNIQEIPNQSIPENMVSINIKGKIENKNFTILMYKEMALRGFETY